MNLVKKSFSFLVIVFFLFLGTNINAQIENPVEWEIKVEKIDDNNIYLVFNAEIEDDWDLYSQFFDAGGPMPLEFFFDEMPDYKIVGITEEMFTPKEKFDDVFKIDIKYFTYSAEFKQQIELLNENGFNLTGAVEGQACYVDGKCIPISHEFDIAINGGAQTTETTAKSGDYGNTPKLVTENQFESLVEDENILSFFFIAVLFGLLAILTPCVFPMIPMTVSFFLQKNSSKIVGKIKALIFGISIVILYTLVGVIVSLTSAGANFTTVLSTNWIPNLIFFVLFVVFAASLFGLFEFVMPSGLVNKADKQVDKGGMISAFFMALTLVIVSFSCTGPIIGALLVQATTGSILMPSIGMFGFGVGFALPFTFLAFSPSLMKKLPKSGGWLNSVKVVMAFLILAFSLKFVSNIDQNYHLNLLSRDVYIAIWIVIAIMLGIYLLGKIKFSHDSDVKNVGFFRLMLAMVSFAFAIYFVCAFTPFSK